MWPWRPPASANDSAEGPSNGNANANAANAVSLEISERGYVTDKAPPHKLYGRITSWGRNISAKCSLHPKCTCAKSTKAVSQPAVMDWLAKGRPVPRPAAPGVEDALREEHQRARP